MKKHVPKILNFIIAFFYILISNAYASTTAEAYSSASVNGLTTTTTTTPTCDKTDQCFAFSYKGYVISSDGRTVTLNFKVTTNCPHDLSYVAFELPSGTTATATGTRRFNYKTLITNNPFPSIKFEGVSISGYKNGVSDEFKYVISKESFNKLTTIRVQAKAATTVGTVTFDKNCNVQQQCIVSNVAITNIKYYVAGVAYTNLQTAVKQGKPVKVCFTVPKSSGYSTYSLVSYKAPYSIFVRAAAHLQEVYDYKTITVGPNGGNFCLEINVPSCFYQVDFVKGCIITRLGPADTNPNNFYGAQGRLLASATGGTVSCVPKETLGNEGCTPGYWKQEQHFGNWAPAVPTGTKATKFFDVFTVCDANNKNCNYQGLSPNLTLLEALKLQGGGFNALARHAAAAYLSSIHKEVDYSITTNEILVGVINAFKTGNLAIHAKLEAANEKNCPLGRSELSTSKARVDKSEPVTNSKTDRLTVYPSPATDKAIVEFTLSKPEAYTVNLHDMQGKVVKQLKAGVAKADEVNQVEVNGKSLTEGMYLVRLVSNSEAKTVKLIIKK